MRCRSAPIRITGDYITPRVCNRSTKPITRSKYCLNGGDPVICADTDGQDRTSTRLNSSHLGISSAGSCTSRPLHFPYTTLFRSVCNRSTKPITRSKYCLTGGDPVICADTDG